MFHENGRKCVIILLYSYLCFMKMKPFKHYMDLLSDKIHVSSVSWKLLHFGNETVSMSMQFSYDLKLMTFIYVLELFPAS